MQLYERFIYQRIILFTLHYLNYVVLNHSNVYRMTFCQMHVWYFLCEILIEMIINYCVTQHCMYCDKNSNISGFKMNFLYILDYPTPVSWQRKWCIEHILPTSTYCNVWRHFFLGYSKTVLLELKWFLLPGFNTFLWKLGPWAVFVLFSPYVHL